MLADKEILPSDQNYIFSYSLHIHLSVKHLKKKKKAIKEQGKKKIDATTNQSKRRGITIKIIIKVIVKVIIRKYLKR